jgi:hypothetical protein
MPRFVVALVCAALAAMAIAPMAIAGSPAGDQYGNPIPGAGNGNGTSPDGGNGSSTSTSGGSGTVIPVAPSSDSGSATSGGGSSSADTGSGGKSAHNGSSDNGSSTGDSTGTPDTSNPVVADSSAHSVPQIAADSAGDSWMPFFIAGLVLLASAFAFLVFFRNRRRTVQN